MAGKHSAQKTGSKKPLAIVLIIIAVLLIAAAVLFFTGVIRFDGDNKNNGSNADGSVIKTTAEVVPTASDNLPDNPPKATEKPVADEDEDDTEPIDINIPTDSADDVSYFNASYIPNGKAEDLDTGESVSIKTLGQSFEQGVLTFNSDGTFSDSLNASGTMRGAYLVENQTVKATYTNDRNMDITVTEWNGNTPSEFYVIYDNGGAGLKVYFSEN